MERVGEDLGLRPIPRTVLPYTTGYIGGYSMIAEGHSLFLQMPDEYGTVELPLVLVPVLNAMSFDASGLPIFVMMDLPAIENVTFIRLAPRCTVANYSPNDHRLIIGEKRPINWLHSPPGWDWRQTLVALKTLAPKHLAVGALMYQRLMQEQKNGKAA